MPDDRCAHIVGVGQSEFTRHGGIRDKTQFQVTAQAVVAALADAGLAPADVDGFASFSSDDNDASLMQVALGVPRLRWASMVWGGGGGGSCGAIAQASAAIEAGHADVVVVYRGLCQGQSGRFGLHGQFGHSRIHANFVQPFGLFAPAQMMALMVRRFMHRYPHIDASHFAQVALSARANANRNPAAVMHDRPMTLDDYFASRFIAEPLRLFDCCLETDGACAVVLTTPARARDLRRRPVRLLASAHGSGPGWGSGPLGSQNMPDADYASTNSRHLAGELFARAGVQPGDVDVAQIYDHFAPMVLMALEDYGFCGAGESGEFVTETGIAWPHGGLPLNTSGGQLSEAYVHGMNLVIEGVRQLRGESTAQVADAQICLVTGGLGVSPTSAILLGRD